MKSNLPVALLDDIKTQLAPLFSRAELYDITTDFIKSVGKRPPVSENTMFVTETKGYYSRERILGTNLKVLNDTEKVEFLSQISKHSRLKDTALKEEIKTVISDFKTPNKSRDRISDLLNSYPKGINEQWKKSYYFYDKTDYRNALDSVRLAIELLVRNVTGKAASLENQRKNLGPLLKQKGISRQVRNFFFNMLDVYEKIQDDNAKHNVPTKLSEEEVSFLMNQSAVIIRFLIDCDKKVNKDAR